MGQQGRAGVVTEKKKEGQVQEAGSSKQEVVLPKPAWNTFVPGGGRGRAEVREMQRLQSRM